MSDLLQIVSEWLTPLSLLALAGGATVLALQSRRLLQEALVLASRERAVEFIAFVLDPLLSRLRDLKQTLETKEFPWAISDEDIAAREIPREHLDLFRLAPQRFYYPVPLLPILEPLLGGHSPLFEPSRFPEMEEGYPAVITQLRALDAHLPSLARANRMLAVQIARLLDSERRRLLPQETLFPYLVHLTQAHLLMDTPSFQRFLERFPKNEEMERAQHLWLESREVLVSRLKGVEVVEASTEALKHLTGRVTETAAKAINLLESIRSQNTERYYISEYLIGLYKEKRLQPLRIQGEQKPLQE